MTIRVCFVYAPDCPNAKETRRNLMTAFSRTGIAPRWTEHIAGAAETPQLFREFGSPTLLIDGADIAGAEPASARSCRLYDGTGVPSVTLIANALRRAEASEAPSAPSSERPSRPWFSRAALLPGLGVALMPKVVCPLCWPAYAGVLGTLGLSFLMEDRWLLPISVVFLGLLLLALGWRAQTRRGHGPLAVGAAAALLILAGKFVLAWPPTTYTGVAALFFACVWNAWPPKARGASCTACSSEPMLPTPTHETKECP